MPVFSKRSFSTAMAIAAYVGQHVPPAQVPDGLILTMTALGWRRLALDLGWRGTEDLSRWNRTLSSKTLLQRPLSQLRVRFPRRCLPA